MADADLAFNPDVPVRDQWGLPPEQEQQVAEAPRPPTVLDTPAPPLPVRPSIDWNAPVQGDQPALDTGKPPTPGVKPPDDVNDFEELKAADLEEEARYKELRSHRGNYDLLKDTVDPKAHPLYPKLERAQQLFNGMTKQEQARWKPQIQSLGRQIMAETKAQNDKVKAELKVQAIQADAPYEDTTKRERTGTTIGTHIDEVAGDNKAKAEDRDPKIAAQGEFNIVVSPLTTMSNKKRDGTVSYEPLRDAATAIATLNGRMQPDVAVKHVMSMATPYGWDPETGKALTGFNGKRGAGARTYQVIGRDIRDNYLVVTKDGTHLRVDPDTMAQIRQAHSLGYKAGQKWMADRKAKADQPDWLTRQLNSIIPGKGF
jgi:hypothetical protein